MNNGVVRIQVVGVGGGGGNAVHHIAQRAPHGIDFVCINTDAQALATMQGARTLQIGEKLTHGHGSGACPDIGRQAAEEDYQRLCESLAATDLVFIAAGLGGGTGTGAAPVIAKAAKEMGALTIAVVTKPFQFEGVRRAEIANAGLLELRKSVDAVMCIPNDRIMRLIGDQTPIGDAFRLTDEVLRHAVTAISELIARVGIINIDYGDIATVMREQGDAMVGFGEASGEMPACKAVRYAMASPLLERTDVVGAKKVLLAISGGRDLTMKDVQEAVQSVHNEIRAEAHVIFGVTTDDELHDTVRVTLIATGLADQKKTEPAKSRMVTSAAAPQLQSSFDFFPADSGRFANIEPTLINNVNYDRPTFMRWGRKLVSDAA
ncbi:MAG: cell division protein FtsZ [bacterium]|nr:cell division protein FtsZ [bacterium]